MQKQNEINPVFCAFGINRVDMQHYCTNSGLPNIITQVKYIKSITKIDRLHYKFFIKKRKYLSSQINLAKKLYKIQELTKDYVVDQEMDTQSDLNSSDTDFSATINSVDLEFEESSSSDTDFRNIKEGSNFKD